MCFSKHSCCFPVAALESIVKTVNFKHITMFCTGYHEHPKKCLIPLELQTTDGYRLSSEIEGSRLYWYNVSYKPRAV